MGNRIITISRQFGSGGRTIGKEVASRLGIPCYDQELIELFAKESGFSENMVAELDEHSARRKLFSDRSDPARQDVYLQRALWVSQEKTILNLAQQGPASSWAGVPVISFRMPTVFVHTSTRKKVCAPNALSRSMAKLAKRLCNASVTKINAEKNTINAIPAKNGATPRISTLHWTVVLLVSIPV